MAIDYDVVDADIYDILPNFLNKKLAFLARSTDSENPVEYIFKPSWIGHYHNPNEYIAHHIGSLIGAPLLNGVFLKISAKNMQDWHKIIKASEPKFTNPAFIPPYAVAYFFAVEFKQDKMQAKNSTDLLMELSRSSNKEKFYSQFSLDQYLRNPDRHFGNHIFYKESHKLMFYLIDFDRIFEAATDWSSLVSHKSNFECFGDESHNKDLYETVCDENIRDVHRFAGLIEKIDDADIDDICGNVLQIYKIEKPKLDMLSQWLKSRKQNLHQACLENEKCYTSVSSKGCFSDSR